jgi:hypothetical protein
MGGVFHPIVLPDHCAHCEPVPGEDYLRKVFKSQPVDSVKKWKIVHGPQQRVEFPEKAEGIMLELCRDVYFKRRGPSASVKVNFSMCFYLYFFVFSKPITISI